jgi:mediator of RNA polymerase II transcription subunit 18
MFQQEQVHQFYRSTPRNKLTAFQVDPKTQQPIPAHADTLWEVEVKTAEPIRNTPETPLGAAIEEALEVQLLMKGLLDLRRQDI